MLVKAEYIEFAFPGILFSDTSAKKIAKRLPPEKVKMPKGAFGFRFFSRLEITRDKEVLQGKNKDYSPWHYFGRKMTLADVIREKPGENILISNMKCNDMKAIVFTQYGQAIPLRDGDIIVADCIECALGEEGEK